MNFKKIFEGTVAADIAQSTQPLDNYEDKDEDYFSIDDIVEMLEELTEEEIQEIGSDIMELIYDPSWEEMQEKQYFDKKTAVVNREKKKNKSQKKKDAKKRKKWYKKNKSKVKRKSKLYRKKTKRQPNQVKKHR